MKRANPAVIGGFVLVALLLAFAGVLLFGSGKLFTETIQAVIYFEGAIQGLNVGAPVNFRGVKVGSVTSIKMQFDGQTLAIRIPVIVEFPKGAHGTMEMTSTGPRTLQEGLVALIERGLRAQLQTTSLVTGLLFVQLDLLPPANPDAPPLPATIDPATRLLEIPTVPTILQEVSNTARKALDKLAELPLEEMLQALEGTLLGVNRLVNAPEILEALRNLNTTMTDVQQLVRRTDGHLERLAHNAATVLGSTQKLATEAQQLVQHLDKQFGHLATSATTTLGQVGKLSQTVDTQALALGNSLVTTATGALGALEQVRDTLTIAQQFLTPSAPVGYELVKMLRELAETARSLRVLADYLERHPNAVVFGRKENAPQ